MRLPYGVSAIVLLVAASPAFSGNTPKYEPSPAWVEVSTPPAPTSGIAQTLLDSQLRVENGRLWTYTDKAVNITSTEALAKYATLSIPWTPDKGDLIIHELSILRDGQAIDLLAKGQRFTILRREQMLEQQEITGILTASLQVEGLRVGDTLRLRMSETLKDLALAGHVQSAENLPAAPTKLGEARLRLSWPAASAIRWNVQAAGVSPVETSKDGFSQIDIKLPIAKQPDMPADAPLRFRHSPYYQFSDFSDWREVSKVMAPLYRTEGAIAPGSPLAAEMAAIEKAETTPIGRAERALELVQDKIRYLAVEMNGGNYVPQAPARTWELRYGDCKAKTMLLLSLLRGMGVEAEPVLASTNTGDLVPDRLPAVDAFNHVLVRANIGGQSLWLDGTGSNSRLADIYDTPSFKHVLPVRPAGADLLTIATRAEGRPTVDFVVNIDESTSSDLPAAVTAKTVFRGALAAKLAEAKASIDDKALRERAVKLFKAIFDEDLQVADAAIESDVQSGTTAVVVHGVVSSRWRTEDRRQKRDVSLWSGNDKFEPDRNRTAWKAIPVVTAGPMSVGYHLQLKLPADGKDASIEGDVDADAHVAGEHFTRHMVLANGVVNLEEHGDALGEEIPAARIPAERDAQAQIVSKSPHIVASASTLRWWQLTPAVLSSSTQVSAAQAAYAKIIANDPEQVDGLTYLSYFHELVLDDKAAIADLDRAIEIAPSVDLYLRRASDLESQGELAKAAADADAARALDPASSEATTKAAWLYARMGQMAKGLAILDEQIAKGGTSADNFRSSRASMVGILGDPREGVSQYDALIAKKPGDSDLLDGRCWVKGTHSIMLETALQDCNSAIELSSNSVSPIDSRAMVYFRLGRFNDALHDLDAVLADDPAYAQSHFLRGVVLNRLNRHAEAEKELQTARTLSHMIEKYNAPYGVMP